MNLPFTRRQSFIHVFQEGRRLVLKVDKTKKEIRFSFTWFPELKSYDELEEVVEEFENWRDYWLGMDDPLAKHNFHDFVFFEACELEMEKRYACLV